MGEREGMGFDERVAACKNQLQGTNVGALYEIANTVPGGPCDAPFAPIDPALHCAARELVGEAGLQKEASLFGAVRGMHGF